MFQSFTGSSRRPRQVNLSGRNANPFAPSGSGLGAQPALASAQQERIQRQRERERLHAAKVVQRTWRGHKCRTKINNDLRTEWDKHDAESTRLHAAGSKGTALPYAAEAEDLAQLRLLLRFFDARNDEDLRRLKKYYGRHVSTIKERQAPYSGGPWPKAYLRLQRAGLAALNREITAGDMDMATVDLVKSVAMANPDEFAGDAKAYYRSMALSTAKLPPLDHSEKAPTALLEAIVAPLQASGPNSVIAYEAFACVYLTEPELHHRLRAHRGMDFIAAHVNHKTLTSALSNVLNAANFGRYEKMIEGNNRTALLGHFIYIYRYAHNFGNPAVYSSNADFIAVVSTLLASIANEIVLESHSQEKEHEEDQRARIRGLAGRLNPFLQDQITSLVNHASISNLFRGVGGSAGAANEADHTGLLANYALTLLRVFPHRGDDIRMWLFLGSTSSTGSGQQSGRMPAIKYFWHASKATKVFRSISEDPGSAIKLLKRPILSTRYGWQAPGAIPNRESESDHEWRVILIFLELYTFVLKVMDDEEFFAGASAGSASASTSHSWTRDNALSLDDVRKLSTFLKNLGFTMYFNAAEISNDDNADKHADGISSYFSFAGSSRAAQQTTKSDLNPVVPTVGGLEGISIDYAKGLVTGLLRMIYERDSRRTFLPKDHWLMTSRFDMEGFIPAVVAEEESRSKIQEAEDEDVDDDVSEQSTSLIGTGRLQYARNIERLQRQQRKASRKRYLQAVAPRLEILQNMPFLIPFHTRVQIFREFVHLDQAKRRNGFIDPDTWRMSVMHSPTVHDNLERHHAKIRRKHEFDDAYAQFYMLKEGLKEPIQITFVDQFDNVEAGIDGGGVTKEFLTSVTNQAFTPGKGLNLFAENEQHLLYPNPTALEEWKSVLNQAAFVTDTPTFRKQIMELLQRYEFLGRIIGKCLYEGILVDINFAGFFLLKWALDGSSGLSPKESSYRANLNDLRELDEALYQGLIQLKNYPGNVEDFSLNFTIVDTIPIDARTGATKNLTRELKPDGATVPVTNENRLVYISYVARHRLQVQPYRQTAAFLAGLGSMIKPSWLSMFNQSEMQTLVSGTSSSIDIADLRRNTLYGGVYEIGDDGQEHPSVQLFWQVMAGLNEEEKRAVLKFVTSTPRAPLLGFRGLNPKFSIRDAGADQERLPSTSTCVNLLKLPRYASAATLKEKLLYAVFSGAGFDLS